MIAEFVGTKSHGHNDSASPIYDKIRIYKDDAVQVRYMHNPKVTGKGGGEVETGNPHRKYVSSLLRVTNEGHLDISYAISTLFLSTTMTLVWRTGELTRGS